MFLAVSRHKYLTACKQPLRLFTTRWSQILVKTLYDQTEAHKRGRLKKKELQTESRKIRGELTSKNGKEIKENKRKTFQVQMLRQMYFMFHKTRPAHLG